MKKFIVSFIGVASLAFSGLLLANGSGAGIVGSPHDFTDDDSDEAGGAVPELAWNLRGEICRVCHVPHDHGRATKYYLNGLLWNHGVGALTYTMYDSTWSSTLDGLQSPQPDGVAKLCLGCHDGTIAIDTFDKYAGTAGREIQNIYGGPLAAFRVPAFTIAGTMDLRGTHPLSIEYDFAGDGGLNPLGDTMGTSGTIADVLDNGKVQCSSCHDVHDSSEAVPNTHLLRVLNNGANPSGLCLTCHDK
jgi:hypothetical protein